MEGPYQIEIQSASTGMYRGAPAIPDDVAVAGTHVEKKIIFPDGGIAAGMTCGGSEPTKDTCGYGNRSDNNEGMSPKRRHSGAAQETAPRSIQDRIVYYHSHASAGRLLRRPMSHIAPVKV